MANSKRGKSAKRPGPARSVVVGWKNGTEARYGYYMLPLLKMDTFAAWIIDGETGELLHG